MKFACGNVAGREDFPITDIMDMSYGLKVSEILSTTKRLRKTYAASGNIARNISNNQRISRAGYNVTQNLARSLKVDSSLLPFSNFRDRRGYTTASRGLANG